jgi:2,4-dienoyl-CoA reductase-like NADH-dependent reductase (Old Yellow Enzyme family)/thioredoxin reductase
MSRRYEHLLKPIKIGNTVFRNRVFTPPMTLHSLQGPEGYPSYQVIEHYASRAKGGAACVTVGGTAIFPGQEDDMHAHWDLSSRHNLYYTQQLVDRIHFYGAKICMEVGVPFLDKPYAAVAGLPCIIPFIQTEELPVEYMDVVADRFADTVENLVTIGVDMIMLHFGHGLVFGQFLSPATNTRTDEYGGPLLENRARFPIMIIDRIRERVGRKIMIELRISGNEKTEHGITEEETVQFVEMIQDKIDIIHCSCGNVLVPGGMCRVHPTSFLEPHPNVSVADKIKKSGKVKIPVVTVGAIQDLDEAEEILANGSADIVSIGRGMIADPELVQKAYDETPEEVVPCIKCLRCHDSACFETHFVCAVNPTTGIETRVMGWDKPAEHVRKVAIIGGGVAGMEAAIVAAKKGHKVTLFEKSDHLGGQLNFADYASFKYSIKKFKKYMIYQTEKSAVDVKLNTQVTPEMIKAGNYDEVIVAIGGVPAFPPIPGLSADKVTPATEVYGHEDKIGETAIVIGGGQVGCETALHLAQKGKKVTIVEMQSELAPDASASLREEIILHLERDENVTILTGVRCTNIGDGSVTIADAEGKETVLTANDLVLAAGMKPLIDEAYAYYDSAKRFTAIGDCQRVRTIEQAMATGFAAAVNIR